MERKSKDKYERGGQEEQGGIEGDKREQEIRNVNFGILHQLTFSILLLTGNII